MAWWKSNGDGTGQNVPDEDWFELPTPCQDTIGATTMRKMQADRQAHIATCDDYRCRAARA